MLVFDQQLSFPGNVHADIHLLNIRARFKPVKSVVDRLRKRFEGQACFKGFGDVDIVKTGESRVG